MDKLVEAAKTLFNITVSEKQTKQLYEYEKLLVEWNQHTNLTTIQSHEDILIKHFLDSISILPFLPGNSEPYSLIDVGTGAGFPGLVLKIMQPAMQLTLVESVQKKAAFCQQVAEKLALDHVLISAMRAEETGHDPRHREQYDYATARAVAGLPVLAEYLLPFIHLSGFMIAMKGENAIAEAEQASPAISVLGGTPPIVHEIKLPAIAEKRYLIIAQKTHPTPEKYPRRTGIPLKRPVMSAP